MHVLATAGHVDHGKSTLVRALTGMEPDRWAEERRRGMTIDLGYAWMTLPSGATLAFVDVPGHQRFISNMLAGVGPAPAAMMVVAADEGWREQSAEHLDALHARGLRHGLLVVTRSDLADPEPVLADGRARMAVTSMGEVEAVAVSGTTGQGLELLRAALDRLVARLPPPDVEGRVRLWVDRAFTVRGSGTVVTGTLGAGRLAVGDPVELRGRELRVRALQQLGRPVDQVSAVARVAVNLRAVEVGEIRRGDALLTPGCWHTSQALDVRLTPLVAEMPDEVSVHVGSASQPGRLRVLGVDTARLTLRSPLPWQVGDVAILRDPARRHIVAGALVIDADPPALTRRGAAAHRAAELAVRRPDDTLAYLAQRGWAKPESLRALGYRTDALRVPGGPRAVGPWYVDSTVFGRWLTAAVDLVDRYAAGHPHQPAIPEEMLRQELGLPDAAMVGVLAAELGLVAAHGRIARPGATMSLGPAERSIASLETVFRDRPFAAPDKDGLAALALTDRDLVRAAKAGRLTRLAPDIVVAADAAVRAGAVLARLEQPFTTSQARQELDITRRVAIPLLEHLDAVGITRRLDAGSRRMRAPAGHG